MAQNRHIYALFGLSTATPKPRAEGSSPSAPAKLKSPKNGLNKPFFGLFFLLFSLENLTAASGGNKSNVSVRYSIKIAAIFGRLTT